MKENFKGFCTIQGAKRCKRAFIKTGWLRPSHTALRYGLYFLLSPAAPMCPCVQLTMLDTICYGPCHGVNVLRKTIEAWLRSAHYSQGEVSENFFFTASLGHFSFCVTWGAVPHHFPPRASYIFPFSFGQKTASSSMWGLTCNGQTLPRASADRKRCSTLPSVLQKTSLLPSCVTNTLLELGVMDTFSWKSLHPSPPISDFFGSSRFLTKRKREDIGGPGRKLVRHSPLTTFRPGPPISSLFLLVKKRLHQVCGVLRVMDKHSPGHLPIGRVVFVYAWYMKMGRRSAWLTCVLATFLM